MSLDLLCLSNSLFGWLPYFYFSLVDAAFSGFLGILWLLFVGQFGVTFNFYLWFLSNFFWLYGSGWWFFMSIYDSCCGIFLLMIGFSLLGFLLILARLWNLSSVSVLLFSTYPSRVVLGSWLVSCLRFWLSMRSTLKNFIRSAEWRFGLYSVCEKRSPGLSCLVAW